MEKIVVPPLGESVKEATIAKWHKNVGDVVKVDELLVELETDKVTLEVNAPSSGVLANIAAKISDTVVVGAMLGEIDQNAKVTAKAVEVVSSVVSVEASSDKAKADAPSAIKMAKDMNIDINNIQGSGKDNRVMKHDIIDFIDQTRFVEKQVETALSQDSRSRESRVKMSKLRQTIAARLKASQNTAAILTTFNEVDMSNIMHIRKEHQELFVKKYGVKLGFMSFFAKAVVSALKEIKAVNAEIQGDEIVYKNYYDIGIAVGTETGLVVPVIRDVDQLSLGQIEQQILAMAEKAKSNKLAISDMTGATFSITNGGTYGSLLSTPIINPPQSGILGMHNIVDRPVVVNGEIVIRPMMYLAFSYDHRIIDGKEAVTFLVKIRDLCQNPTKMLLDL